MIKVTVKEINKIVSPLETLINVIYNNFNYLTDPNLGHTKDEIYRLLTSNQLYGLLVYHDKQLIAYLIGEFKILVDNRYVYYITYIYVSDKYRNKRIGIRLIINILNKCNNKGVKFVLLTFDTSNNKLIRFYNKLGFKKDPILGTGKRHDVYSYFL
jgi:ribosomal protein S18 acetylase RimI-like enzyme